MPTKNPYLPTEWEIVDLREEIPGHFFMAMVLPDNGFARPFPAYRPGQFFSVTVPGIGEAPLSVSSTPTRPGVLEMCFRKMGRVTSALSRMRPGMHVGLRGPLGNGYPMERVAKKDVLLVAGGMGMVPLRSLMKHVLDCPYEFGHLSVLYGSNDDDSFLFFRELAEARRREGVTVKLIAVKSRPGTPYHTEFGGQSGLVTDLIAGTCPDPAHTFVALCGPPIFYRYAVKTLLAEGYNKNQVYMSLERRMECGIGKCGHCTVGYRYTCIEGPIFNYWDAFNLPELIEMKEGKKQVSA
jgi:sulfhydrogenase subunit gamma (sulfur reductase)